MKKRDLNKIRRSLPEGAKDEIILQSSKSKSMVDKVLLGIRNNEEILRLAIDFSELPVEKKHQLLNELN